MGTLEKTLGTERSLVRMIPSSRHLIKSQKGATVVEFAIVFPLLILLLFAIIEFGLYTFNRQVITNACREGARFGVVSRVPRYNNAQIQQKVVDYSAQHLVTFGNDTLELEDVEIDPINNDMSTFDPDDATEDRCTRFEVIYDNAGTPTPYRCELEVKAVYRYHFLFLSTVPGFPDFLDIHGEAKMRME